MIVSQNNHEPHYQRFNQPRKMHLAVMIRCKWHGHDPFAYFNDVLKKVTTWSASKIDDLLPVNWTPPAQSTAPKLDPLSNQVA